MNIFVACVAFLSFSEKLMHEQKISNAIFSLSQNHNMLTHVVRQLRQPLYLVNARTPIIFLSGFQLKGTICFVPPRRHQKAQIVLVTSGESGRVCATLAALTTAMAITPRKGGHGCHGCHWPPERPADIHTTSVYTGPDKRQVYHATTMSWFLTQHDQA